MLRRMVLMLAAMVTVGLMSVPVRADELASTARWLRWPGHQADVNATMLAPSPCYAMRKGGQYAPPGGRHSEVAVPFTIIVEQSPNCQKSRQIRDVFTVFPPGGIYNVALFFVSPSGKRLKTEEIAIMSQ